MAHRTVLSRLLALPAILYRHGAGWALGRRFALVGHVGRRSGRHYSTVVEVMRYDRAGEVLVMAGFGKGSDWYRNVTARGEAAIDIGGDHFEATVRVLEEDEAVGVLAGYERRMRLAGPLVRLVLSRLLGWRYRGGVQDRRRAVRQLPIVGFARR